MILNKMTDDDIIKKINNFFKISNNYKQLFISQWMINIAYYLGEQNIAFNKSLNSLVKVPEMNAYKVISNQIMPRINNKIARYSTNLPVWEVEPTFSVSPKFKQIARVTQKLINYIERITNEKINKKKILYYVFLTGNCFEKIYIDKVSKDEEYIVDNNYSIIRKDEVVNYESYKIIKKYENKIACEIVSPFNFFVDTDIVDFSQAKRCMVVKYISKEELKNINNEINIDELPTESINISNNLWGQIYANFYKRINDGVSFQTRDITKIYEYYQKADDEFPDGLIIYICGNKIIYKGNNYTPNGELPFIHYYDLDNNEYFWKDAITTQAISLQNEYNSIKTQIDLTRRITGLFSIIADKDDEVNIEQHPDFPALLIKTSVFSDRNQASIQPQILPNLNYLYSEKEDIKRDIDDLFNTHDVSLGRNPKYISSGTALAFLSKKDDESLSPFFDNYVNSLTNSMRLKLKFIKKYYPESKIQEICGNDIFIFDFYNIKDYIIDEQISLKPNSLLPNDINSNREYFLQLAPYLSKFETKRLLKKYPELIEFGGIEDYYNEREISISKAMRENKIMAQGIYVEVIPYIDDNEIELEEHISFFKSNDFKEYIKFIINNPEHTLVKEIINNIKNVINQEVDILTVSNIIIQYIDEHIKSHYIALQQMNNINYNQFSNFIEQNNLNKNVNNVSNSQNVNYE